MQLSRVYFVLYSFKDSAFLLNSLTLPASFDFFMILDTDSDTQGNIFLCKNILVVLFLKQSKLLYLSIIYHLPFIFTFILKFLILILVLYLCCLSDAFNFFSFYLFIFFVMVLLMFLFICVNAKLLQLFYRNNKELETCRVLSFYISSYFSSYPLEVLEY